MSERKRRSLACNVTSLFFCLVQQLTIVPSMRLLSFSQLILSTSTSPSLAEAAINVSEIPSEAYIQVDTDPKGITWPWRVFKSSPYTPPNLTITGNGGELAPGYVFMTPVGLAVGNTEPAAEESGGFIITTDNELVYALNDTTLTDFRVQDYDGVPYLTYWSGYNSQGLNIGHGYGQVNFLDATYQSFIVDPYLGLNKLTNTTVANWSIDIHEHQLTPRNTLLVSAYNNTPYDLSSLGGPANGWITDSLFYELDIETWEVLFSWAALDYIDPSTSHQPLSIPSLNVTFGNISAPWDWFHVNSVDIVGDDYLVNARHTWTTYAISRQDSSVIWALEGQNGGDFGAPPADSTFRWQHYARAHNVTATSLDLSLFDNHNAAYDNGTAPSHGYVYHLELPASKSYTPEVTRKIETTSEEIYADSQGDYIADLSNGNQLVGYGQITITREYGPATDGSDLRWQAQFGGLNTVQSYRAFKDVWVATPADWDPSLVVEDGQAYVSWNGATEVTDWNVYTTLSSGTVIMQVAAKKGFETTFKVQSGAQSLQVGAVQDGAEVRKSNVVTL